MPTTTTTRTRYAACAERLGVDLATAHAICDRNVATCEAVVAHLSDAWEAAADDSCCKARTYDADGQPEYQMACEHLLALWAAKGYLSLARLGAPTTDAYPCCKCPGTGLYTGATANGGTFSGTCWPCVGKGWMTSADRKRTENYWNYFARI